VGSVLSQSTRKVQTPMPRDFSHAKDLAGCQGTVPVGVTPFGGPNIVVNDDSGSSSSSSEAGNGGIRVQITTDLEAARDL